MYIDRCNAYIERESLRARDLSRGLVTYIWSKLVYIARRATDHRSRGREVLYEGKESHVW